MRSAGIEHDSACTDIPGCPTPRIADSPQDRPTCDREGLPVVRRHPLRPWRPGRHAAPGAPRPRGPSVDHRSMVSRAGHDISRAPPDGPAASHHPSIAATVPAPKTRVGPPALPELAATRPGSTNMIECADSAPRSSRPRESHPSPPRIPGRRGGLRLHRPARSLVQERLHGSWACCWPASTTRTCSRWRGCLGGIALGRRGDLPDRLEQLRHQRDPRRPHRPQPPGQAAPARSRRAGCGCRWPTRSGSSSASSAWRWPARSTGRSSARRAVPAGHGAHLQRPAGPHPRSCPTSTCCPSRSTTPSACCWAGSPSAGAEFPPVSLLICLLDDRRLLHGQQALRRVPLDRRPGHGRRLPQLVPPLRRADGCSSACSSTPPASPCSWACSSSATTWS